MGRWLRGLVDRLSGPGGATRLGVVFLGACALVAALIAYPATLRELGTTASANSALSYADRDVGGGNSVLPEQRAAYEIRGRIPPDARYTVQVGDPRPDWTDLTAVAGEPFLRYWLLPRIPSEDAEWIVCVGCDDAALAARATRLWEGEAGISLWRRTP